MYLNKFRTYKITLPPQTKPAAKSPSLVNFEEKPTFRVWCLYRYLVHGKEYEFVFLLTKVTV